MITWIGSVNFALTEKTEHGYIAVVSPKVIRDLGGIRALSLSREGRNWWAIMAKFHLPPNDPRIQTMTLDQRNYCIINMNQDANLAQGKTGDVAADTTADKWLHVSDKDFHVIPQTIASSNPKKTVLHNLRKRVGLSELELDDKIWQRVKKQAPMKHATKVKEDQMAEEQAADALADKAKAYKKAGIDKSDSWNNFLGDNSKNNFDI